MLQELEFGFVPHHIVNDLQDIGNWKVLMCSYKYYLLLGLGQIVVFMDRSVQLMKHVQHVHCLVYHTRLILCSTLLSQSRANAIDNLHKSLRDVYDRSQIMPELSKFVSFLVQLVSGKINPHAHNMAHACMHMKSSLSFTYLFIFSCQHRSQL